MYKPPLRPSPELCSEINSPSAGIPSRAETGPSSALCSELGSEPFSKVHIYIRTTSNSAPEVPPWTQRRRLFSCLSRSYIIQSEYFIHRWLGNSDPCLDDTCVTLKCSRFNCLIDLNKMDVRAPLDDRWDRAETALTHPLLDSYVSGEEQGIKRKPVLFCSDCSRHWASRSSQWSLSHYPPPHPPCPAASGDCTGATTRRRRSNKERNNDPSFTEGPVNRVYTSLMRAQ